MDECTTFAIGWKIPGSGIFEALNDSLLNPDISKGSQLVSS